MSYNNLPRKHSLRLSTPVRLGVAAVAACFLAGPLLANPVNPVVVNGAASFNQAGKVLTVTNSNGAIINWDKFSIKAGETTRFIQPTASSTVLNRVLSDPTAIYGTLSSNGRVWLVNPAGIMVGAGGRVDVAGFVASTLNISNADFLAGRRLFANDGSAKDVINQGEIRTPSGGSVYLIGSNVGNEGIITTPKGETILAAGQTVSLIDSATPGVKVDITGAEGNATNLGQITAEAGRIGIAGVIVRNSGNLNASSVVSEGGRIFLKASQDAYVDKAGRIVTTGNKGGRVEVLGDKVTVTDNAEIDASGTQGGGQILVGGDYQGKNAHIQNASTNYLGKDAVLKADAIGTGDGGKVILWANDRTEANGTISARGGVTGGNGGFVETSGHQLKIGDTARVTTSALHGKAGTWLLDPYDFTIASSDGDITGATLSSALYSTDVLIQTTESGASCAGASCYGGSVGSGDIFVNDTILKTGGGTTTLTLAAYRSIEINAPIGSAGGVLNVNLQARATDGPSGNVGIFADITTNGGNLWVGGGSALGGTGYAIGYDPAGSISQRYGISIDNATISTGGGFVKMYGRGVHDAAGDADGIDLWNSSAIIDATGPGSGGHVTLNGIGGNNPTDNTSGVYIGGTVKTNYSGDITIIGQGGSNIYTDVANRGVRVDDGLVMTQNGYLSIHGTGGGGNSEGNVGILIDPGTWIKTTGTGSIDLTGLGGGGTGRNHGIYVDGGEEANTRIASYGGSVLLTGTAGGHTASQVIASSAIRIAGDALIEAPASWPHGRVDLTSLGGEIHISPMSDEGIDYSYDPHFVAGDRVTLATQGDDVYWVADGSLGGSNVYIDTSGRDASSDGAPGGDAGKVTLASFSGNVSVGGIDADGGEGGSGNATHAGGKGGKGGIVSITADSSYGGLITVFDYIRAEGGSNQGNANSEGGDGGSISLYARNLSLLDQTSLSVRGGDGGDGDGYDHHNLAGGNGGKGGSISLEATSGGILFPERLGIDARGGDGGAGDDALAGGVGGAGGKVSLVAYGSINLDGGEGWVNASGGHGGAGGAPGAAGLGGAGGDAGGISFFGGNVLLSGDPMFNAQIIASGGHGGSDGGLLDSNGNGGHAGKLKDAGNNPIPNISLVATISIDGAGIQLLPGVWVESMGGQGGVPGQDGWVHMDSKAGILQPVNDSNGSFRTGRLTFPYDAGNQAVGTVGQVSFLGQSNYIGEVTGRALGNFIFDGRCDVCEPNTSQLDKLGIPGAPLVVGGNLNVRTTDSILEVNATAVGSATIVADGSISITGSLTAGSAVMVAAGENLSLSGTVESTGSTVDMRSGWGEIWDCPDGCSWVWQPSGLGGDLTLAAGSKVRASDDIWLEAVSGTPGLGDLKQLGSASEIKSFHGNVTIVAGRDISLAGIVSAPDAELGGEVIVAAGRDLTISGTISGDSGVDLEAGVSFTEGYNWAASGLGGNLWLTSSSVVNSGDYIYISAEGDSDGRPGWVKQDAGGTITSTGSSSVDIFAWDNLTLNSVSALGGGVTLSAGYSYIVDGDNPDPIAKNLYLGHINAAGGSVSANATGDIDVVVGNAGSNFGTGASFTAGAGHRWAIWAPDPSKVIGAPTDYDFKHYNMQYSTANQQYNTTAGPLMEAGNGLFYASTPTITVGLTGTVSKIYNATTTADLSLVTFSAANGAIDGDDVVVGNKPALGSFDTKDVGTGKTVTASGLTLTALDAAEKPVYGYIFSGTASGAVGEITSATLGFSGFAANNKVYDATRAATVTGTLTGVFAGDDVSVTSPGATFADKNVGTGKAVSLGTIALAGVDARNYIFTAPLGVALTADITKAELNVTDLVAKNKVYDGTATAKITGTLAGLLEGDVVNLASSSVFADRHVGVQKAVNVSGLALLGDDAGNYKLTLPAPGSVKANITQLASVDWVGGTDNKWSTAANWSGGAVPDRANVAAVNLGNAAVVYDYSAATVTADAAILNKLTGTGSLTLSGGSLTLNGGLLSIANWVQTAGDLLGTGALTVTQSMAMSGAGIIDVGGPVSITHEGDLKLGRIETDGALSVTATGALSGTTEGGSWVHTAKSIALDAFGIGAQEDMLQTRTGTLTVANRGGDAWIYNTGLVKLAGFSAGGLYLESKGGIQTGSTAVTAGNKLRMIARSPITIGSGGVVGGTGVSLSATTPGSTNSTIYIAGPVSSPGGSVAVAAYNNVVQAANITGANVSVGSATGNIVMAPAAQTQATNGSIAYNAPAGSIVLASLNAGSGSVSLGAGGSIASAPGFTGVNITSASAHIESGGSLQLETDVALLDVDVVGDFKVTNGSTVFSSQPASSEVQTGTLINDIVKAAESSAEGQTGQDTPSFDNRPDPNRSRLDPHKTIGGTEGSFGDPDEDKDKKDKRSDQSKDRQKDDKAVAKKVAQCSF